MLAYGYVMLNVIDGLGVVKTREVISGITHSDWTHMCEDDVY